MTMTCPAQKNGPDKDHEVSIGDFERIRHAQEIQPRCGQHDADPGSPGGLLAEEQAEKRDEHDIKAGDESGIARGGIHEPHLLARCAGKKQAAGHKPDLEHAPWPGGFLHRPLPPHAGEDDDRKKHQRAEGKAGPVKGEGSDVLHPDTLRHEGKAPDQSRDEEQQVGPQGAYVHERGRSAFYRRDRLPKRGLRKEPACRANERTGGGGSASFEVDTRGLEPFYHA